MKLKSIAQTRANEIEFATEGRVQFKMIDGSVKGVRFFDPAVGQIFVEIDSYSIRICEIATKKVFKLGFFHQVADDKMFVEKQFDSESEREEFINRFLFETPTDELALHEVEVEEE